jgi:molybdopterin-guanine dinucleotide biosynthesis protein A
MRRGAIILCGGRSSRMGRDKAWLPVLSETMLQRVVRLLSEVVAPSEMAVVAAAGQRLPALPPEVTVVRDSDAYQGPLAGLAGGLRALNERVDAAYATGCDAPLLVPAFVERIFAELGQADAVVPYDGERVHPLAAVYRVGALATAERLLAAHQVQLRKLPDALNARRIDAADLRLVDAELRSLRNLNSMGDYARAIASLSR